MRRRPDHYARRAKREGSPARSVYKLEEIDRRFAILRGGMYVLDLGCAPGSWLLYAAGRVQRTGRVLGIDIQTVDVALPPQATTRVDDANTFDLDAVAMARRFDVVLSDMAPATMGHHAIDAIRSAALATRALDVAERVLASGGNTVVKVLEGGEVPDLVQRMRASYAKVARVRPKATRFESTEIFLVGLGHTPAAGEEASTREASPTP